MEDSWMISLPWGFNCPQPSMVPEESTATTKRCQSKSMGLMPTSWISRRIAEASFSVAGRSVDSTKQTCRQDNRERRDEPMDQKGIDEGARPIRDPAECKPSEDG